MTTTHANLLAALPDSVRQTLMDRNHTVKYPRGAQILRQEDDSKDVFYINYGRVLVTFYTEKGDIITLEINTMPGLSNQSFFPKAAKFTGLDMAGLSDKLVKLVLESA